MSQPVPNHVFVEAPTLYPTEEDFNDPIGFLSQPAIVSLAELYGILKLVPPKGWKPKFSINKDTFRFHTRLQKLSELNLRNRPKIFFFESLNNYLKMKSKNDISEDSFKLEDGRPVDIYALFQITEFEVAQNKDRSIDWKKINTFFGLAAGDQQLRNFYDQNLKGYSKYVKQRKHLLRNMRQDDDIEGDHCMICFKNDDPQHTLICDGCEETYHMKCLSPPMKRIPENDWYCEACLLGTFDYGFEEDFDSLYTISEFSEYCKKFEKKYFKKRFGSETRPSLNTLETEFWRLVDGTTLDEEDRELEMRYGADIHNTKLDEISGFPTVSNPSINTSDPAVEPYLNHPFNLTNLPFAKGSLLNYIRDSEISGMTVPWIYVGSLFSTFCWHKEDHYTLSSNYCHFGSTKKWYGIPAKFELLFEKIVADSAPEYFKRQPDLLHQLVTLLSPSELFTKAKDQEMTIVYANQNENEFIITYPKVYHAGFNTGLNFNEAVNFTMPYWIRDGDRAIDDYKKVHKENVFNYYQLSQRIMDEFLHHSADQIRALDERYKGDYTNMIKVCLRDFSKAFKRSNQLQKQISANIPDLEKKLYVKSETEQTEGPKRRGRKKKVKEEELLCDVCKTFLSFDWVKFSNARLIHENSQLLTPEQTPKMLDEEKPRSCEESEFQRIINEAKKLSEATGQKMAVGLGIRTENDEDEPIAKRRRSNRAEKPKAVSLDESASPTSKKTRTKLTEVKLCLEDFIVFLNNKEPEARKKLFRNFETEDMHEIAEKYGSLYYDHNRDETTQFIAEVDVKLNSTL